MWDSIKHHCSVYYFFLKLAVARQIERPFLFMSWLIMIPCHYFTGIWILKILVERFHPLNGWDFPELAFLYGLGLLSQGFMVIFFIQAWQFDSMINRGGFDRMLLRPLSVFFQFIWGEISLIGVIDILPGVIIFVYACKNVHMEWNLLVVFKIVLTVFGATLIRGSFLIVLGAISFWTQKSGDIVNASLGLLDRVGMYPLTIYPYFVQILFTFIIPLGFISFYPTTGLLDKSQSFHLPFGLVFWTPIIGACCYILANFMFLFGLKKYSSTGS